MTVQAVPAPSEATRPHAAPRERMLSSPGAPRGKSRRKRTRTFDGDGDAERAPRCDGDGRRLPAHALHGVEGLRRRLLLGLMCDTRRLRSRGGGRGGSRHRERSRRGSASGVGFVPLLARAPAAALRDHGHHPGAAECGRNLPGERMVAVAVASSDSSRLARPSNVQPAPANLAAVPDALFSRRTRGAWRW